MKTNCTSLIRGYSKAIFAIATQLTYTAEYLKLLENLNEFIQNSTVKIFIKNNLLPYEAKANFLIDLITSSLGINQLGNAKTTQAPCAALNTLLENFIKLLSINNHLILLPKIYLAYEELYINSTNALKIKIISAVPIELDLAASLKEHLAKYFKKTILLTYTVDQTIIGGLSINYKDQIIDYSLKGKLLQFKKTLITT